MWNIPTRNSRTIGSDGMYQIFQVVIWMENSEGVFTPSTFTTHDLGHALGLLKSCHDGAIYLGAIENGEIIAGKDNPCRPVEFFNGWTKEGKVIE